MTPPPPRPSVSPPVPPYATALADDPSGATETARALGTPVCLSLDAADVTEVTTAYDLVMDLDTRRPPPADAAHAVGTAEPDAVARIAHLTVLGAHHVPLDPAALAT